MRFHHTAQGCVLKEFMAAGLLGVGLFCGGDWAAPRVCAALAMQKAGQLRRALFEEKFLIGRRVNNLVDTA